MFSMTSGSVLAVCLVHELLPTRDAVGVSAIDKRPVEGEVPVYAYGLTGDVQADRRHHGGPSKAVYAYSQADADFWSRELGRDIPPGLFGENLRTGGIDASGAVLGERWRIGSQVELEVTCPRTPCRNFQQRMAVPKWAVRFTEAGRPGAYLKVLKRGKISAGDSIDIIHRPGHGVTVADVAAGLGGEQAAALRAAQAERTVQLSPEILKVLRRLPVEA